MRTAHLGHPRQGIRIENELLLCCAANRIDEEVRNRIRALVQQGPDWTHLIQTALTHGVVPQLYRTLEQVCRDDVPADLLAALRLHIEENAARNRLLADELVATERDLAKADIPVIAFKGPSLAHAVYGDVSLRSAGDLDILIHPQDVEKACEVLAARGYRDPENASPVPRLQPHLAAALRRVETEYQFVRDSDHVMIEPHWALAPSTLAVNIDYEGLWRRAKPISLDGGAVTTLAEEDLLLVLCIHGSKHEWVQLRWICDIACLISAFPRIDWDTCFERARHQGVERMVLLGLALADRVCGTAMPEAIQARVKTDSAACALAQRTCERLFVEGNATPSPSRITAYRFRMRERWRDRVSYVLRTVFTPLEKHLAMVQLPAPLYFLYYPIKVIHDYLLLPAWLAARHVFPAPTGVSGNKLAQAKEAVRARWTANARLWDRWADELAWSSQRINDLLIEAAEVTSGQAVLDLASGAGEPALSIAERAGGDGLVVATDLVPAMLSTTRRRADAAGIQGLDCCAADMEALPFADAVFDRVVCRLGIMFSPRPDRALAEAHRVLKPGGRVAFLVWGRLEGNTVLKILREAVGGLDGDLAGAEQLTPFRFAETDDLPCAMRQAGFAGVRLREERFDATLPADSRFWQPTLEMTFGNQLANLKPEARALMERNIETAFDDCLDEAGYRISVHVRIAVGVRE